MSVTYLKDEYVVLKQLPIATKAIKQILGDIKGLSLTDKDTMRAIRGTVSAIVATAIDKSRENRTSNEESEIYFKEVHRILTGIIE